MKPEEALKYIKDFIDNEEPQIGAYNTEVLKKAIGALEKQIPKKPNQIHDMYENGYPYYAYVCDECGDVIDETKDEFCPNCGQAIDWDDFDMGYTSEEEVK